MLRTQSPNVKCCGRPQKTTKIQKDSTKFLKKHHLRTILKIKLLKSKIDVTSKSISSLQKQADAPIRTQPKELFYLMEESKCTCPLCLEIVVKPVLLECGHIFCMQCY
jgi:hypothetical protein